MSTEEYRTVRNQAQRLSTDEQFRLLEDLVAMLRTESRPQHSILEFKGVGKEVWEGVDVEEYIRQERDSWEPKNDEQESHSVSRNLSPQANDALQEEKQVGLLVEGDSDQYVLAIMVYELFNGLPPFTEGTAGELQVEDMTEKIVQKLVNIRKRDSQAWRSLTKSMRQMLNSLRNVENTNLQGRDVEEKIT